MDLLTLAAINLVIGLFSLVYFWTEFFRNKHQKYFLEFTAIGLCLVTHATFAIVRESIVLPYFILPAFANTLTVIINLLVMSMLYRLLQVPLSRMYLMIVALLTYFVWFLPLLQQDLLSRLLMGFAIMITLNILGLRLLYKVRYTQFRKVVTFFKYVLLFNILQMLIRSILFINGKISLTALEPHPFVYQLGWFSLTIFAACILTGGLLIVSQQRLLELEARAERDPLTGLLNRYSMQQRFSAELNRCQRSQQPLTLLIFDIDHFKRVNDTFGHQVGDQVLQQIAAVSQATFRNYDLVFRMGGEEFLVCLPGTGQQQAAEKAELLRQQVQALNILPETTVTISIGFVVATPGQDLDALIKQADDALYHAKGAGRNRAVSWCSGALVLNV